MEIGDEIKSISGEETFLKDTDERKILRACLKEQAADISARLKHKRLGAHTVQVKVRYADFTTLTRQISVEEPLTEANDIYRLGCFLLGREKLVSRPLRLLGLPAFCYLKPADITQVCIEYLMDESLTEEAIVKTRQRLKLKPFRHKLDAKVDGCGTLTFPQLDK